MTISVGIMAHNEENNIPVLINSILVQTIKSKIAEIIVVSSSTDSTHSIIQKFQKKNSKITLVIQNKRFGKAAAINEFLSRTKSKILVLVSADTILEKNALERLMEPLKNPTIGITCGHPIPLELPKTNLDSVLQLQWQLHHELSKRNPKCGELIAFRNYITCIPNTAADEEFISMEIRRKGYQKAYASHAIIHIKTPKTYREHILQRRRIYWGHLELFKKYQYTTPSFDSFQMLTLLLSEMLRGKILIVLLAASLEIVARFLGYADYVLGKKHYVWEMAKSTKSKEK